MPVAVCPMPDLEPANKTSTFMVYSCPDGYVFGAACRLNCTHGYPLIGSDTITCERDDSTYPPTMSWDWSGPSAVKPVCKGRAPPLMDLCAQVCMNSRGFLPAGIMNSRGLLSAGIMNSRGRLSTGVRELSWTSVHRYAWNIHAQVCVLSWTSVHRYKCSHGSLCTGMHTIVDIRAQVYMLSWTFVHRYTCSDGHPCTGIHALMDLHA